MVVPWEATQLAREDREPSDGYRSLDGRRARLPGGLEGTRRKSGRTLSLPVVVAIVEGERYLVSMLGENVSWVRKSGGREEIQLEEVPADQRAPILKAYLQRAPGARPHVPVNKDAPLPEFQMIAAAFPVFRVVSRKTGQGEQSG